MGVNLFVLIRRADYKLLKDLETLVEKINKGYGKSDGFSKASRLFEFAEIFKGDGGWLYEIQEAKGFPDDSEPWFIINDHTLEVHCKKAFDSADWDWRAILDRYRLDENDYQVVFLKARI